MSHICSCHGVEMRSQRDPRYSGGRRWYCAVAAREYGRRRSRAKGIPELGSPEYLAKVRKTEPAYRTMHHRARKALSGTPCAHCGETEGIEAALRHDGSPSSRRISPMGLAYSVTEDDYLGLCRQCHIDYDGVRERVTRWHASLAA